MIKICIFLLDVTKYLFSKDYIFKFVYEKFLRINDIFLLICLYRIRMLKLREIYFLIGSIVLGNDHEIMFIKYIDIITIL